MKHESFLKAIDGGFAWELVEAYERQPREAPEEVNRGAEMIAERLRARGLPVMMHQPRLFLSLPKSAAVELDGKRLFAKPPAFSKPAPHGLTAPLTYVPSSKREYARYGAPPAIDVAGKIIVTEGISLPMVLSEMEALGALGVIAVNPGHRIHWGTASTIWGTPEMEDVSRLPKIPSVAVNREDGVPLIAAAKAGKTATLFSELEVGWFPQNLPVVDIPGAIEPDRFVFLHGHYDSWKEGVGDNGTGNACMLEIARVLWEKRSELRRSVRLAWWPAHSTGRYGGSSWYLDAHAFDLLDRCVFQMNCDSPGCKDATSYENITMMPEAVKAVTAIVERVTGQTPKAKRPNRSSDYSFYNLGVSGAFMASSMMPKELVDQRGWHHVGGCGGNIAWHTEDDRIDICDKGVLEKDIALYLEAATTFANAEILPLDWRDGAAEIRAAIESYAALSTGVDLSDVVKAIGDVAADVAKLHAKIDAKAIAPRAANDALIALSRALVPLNYARGGRFHQDAALTLPPVPALSVAEDIAGLPDDLKGFARTNLLRGKNETLAALRAAKGAIAAALG
ncbi:M28 family metallopeptidase [Terrarubrum flagellatum]|uniref:M28 family metallopeptidase n=1 Tax=Terrirubrum flagellatum TaxID=2895980 RepID=UPI0031450B2F